MDETCKRLKEMGVKLITIDGVVIFNANDEGVGDYEAECKEDKQMR